MSGETEKNNSAWTVDTSHQHLQDKVSDLEKLISQRFIDNDKAIQAALLAAKEAVAAALSAAKEAVTKAELSNAKMFEAANAVKATFSADLGKKLDRTEYSSNRQSLEDKITALTDRMNRSEGNKSGVSAAWGSLSVVVGLVIAAVSLILAFNN